MELTMTNNFGFCELNENEMMMVDGGGFFGALVGTGAGIGSAYMAATSITGAVVSGLGMPAATTAVSVATCAASGPVGWILLGGAAAIGIFSACVGYAAYCSVVSYTG